ncbi:hypothetical protein ACF08M_30005 [Streptomyces sp. NPDC015032]|uniref:hypothetical protein n=1 Tax=Streptomyces sp. NPDC015032 TaxID=3364937 RepID=UPI0036FA9DE8
MHSSHHPDTTDQNQRIHHTKHWLARRRHALLSSALRGAAYATGAGIVGLGFWWIQQQP